MRYVAEVKKFCADLHSGIRPTTFEEAYALCNHGICGLWEAELRALWDILQREDIQIMAEIGRFKGGALFMFACACPNLKFVRSIDAQPVLGIDEALRTWLTKNGIHHQIEVNDSRFCYPEMQYDFVYIDGGHRGMIVNRDLENWRERTRLIGFHDFADRGRSNAHRCVYPDVVAEVKRAREAYNWEQVGERGRSEIVFRVT